MLNPQTRLGREGAKRNERIMSGVSTNQSCAMWCLGESKLREIMPQNPFSAAF
jgi:hypothetical protein